LGSEQASYGLIGGVALDQELPSGPAHGNAGSPTGGTKGPAAATFGSFSSPGQKFAEHQNGKPPVGRGANVESVRRSCQSCVSGSGPALEPAAGYTLARAERPRSSLPDPHEPCRRVRAEMEESSVGSAQAPDQVVLGRPPRLAFGPRLPSPPTGPQTNTPAAPTMPHHMPSHRSQPHQPMRREETAAEHSSGSGARVRRAHSGPWAHPPTFDPDDHGHEAPGADRCQH
jgi:hypothetical protein